MEKEYLKECNIVRIYHRDALSHWDEINSRTNFALKLESVKDGHSEDKVVVEYRSEKNDNNYEIGELSKDDSKDLIIYLKQGWSHIFSATICHKDDKADEDKRLKAVIYIEGYVAKGDAEGKAND